jgi:transposase
VHQLRAWGTGELKLHTHILYNPEKALKDRNDLYGYVTDLIKKAEADPNHSQLKEDFDKYLMIRRSEKQESGYTISIREDIIQKQLRHAGWLVLISNTVSSTQEAHDLYRIKDVVEKGFCKFKNSLGLSRLHIQSNDRMQNKIFVGFIALILMSWIHKNMSDKGMYKQMTFDKMMLTLSKIKIATIHGQRILRPLTKDQKQILQQLGVDAPVG